jgi:HD-GYP domain-containing protein (c-di-GMP phosphodiesterase class II)
MFGVLRAAVDLTLALFLGLRGSSKMIDVWSQALEEKDPGTWSHCKRVAGFATALAQALRLDDKEIQVIAIGALLHEIGRLAIPKAILRKPAKLTPEEMLVMRESPTRGYETLRNIPSLAGAAEIVYAHRERFDGTGYPRGLKGEAIPLGARIIAIADTFEMFISDRPHDLARGLSVARREVLHWSGRQLDPHIVEAFLSLPDDAITEGLLGALK